MKETDDPSCGAHWARLLLRCSNGDRRNRPGFAGQHTQRGHVPGGSLIPPVKRLGGLVRGRRRVQGSLRGRHPVVDEDTVGSLVAESRRTTILELPRGSRPEPKTALQVAHRPTCGTLEKWRFPTNSSDDMLF
jgi:hypothetical protein